MKLWIFIFFLIFGLDTSRRLYLIQKEHKKTNDVLAEINKALQNKQSN